MNNASKRSLLAAAIAFIAGGSQGVIAQQNDMAESQSRIDEIIVTATKRETSLQETAMSISVLTEETLKNRGITTAQDFYTTIPGISAADTSPGESNISMRGVATDIFRSGNSLAGSGASLSTYLGEFPITRGTRDIRLIDVGRVEVLKGPQGTLYGQAAISGVLRYMSNEPNSDALSGNITSTLSSTANGGNNYNVHGHLNLPITDNLAARAVFYRYDNDGFIDVVGRLPKDNANDEETVGGRLAVKWDITNDLTFDLLYLKQEIDLGSTYIVTDTFDPSIGLSTLTPADFDNPKSQFARVPYKEDEMLNLKLSAKFDAFDLSVMGAIKELTDIGSVDEGNFLGLTDSGAISDGENDSDIKTFELRLVSNDSDDTRFSWLAGIWYEDLDRHTDRAILHEGPDALLFGFLAVTDGFVYTDVRENRFEDEFSVYGEVTFHFTQQTALTLGARRADVEVEHVVLSASGPLSANSASLIGVDTRVQEDANTYRINLEHNLNDDMMFYAQASSGYRAGGFNIANPIAGVPASSFGSDTLWNYELGARTTWLDGRLVANASLYRIDWDDIQLRTQTASPSGVRYSVTDNVGEATIDGLELELNYVVNEALRLGLNYAHTNPELAEDYVQGNGVVVPDGTQLPNTAKNTYALFAQYQQALTSEMDLQVFVTHRYIDNRLAAFGTGDATFKPFEFPELEITDLRIGINHQNGLTATLFANNVFNEIEPSFIAQGNITQYRINKPRTIGVTVGYTF